MHPVEKVSRAERNWLIAILLLGGIILAVGWRVFWFLTDDAYIAFRYISNAHLGYGYVWNAPPFLPVEGYTSFLWVVLLDVVWRVFGVEPPASANWISLLFSYFALLLGAAMIMQIRWHSRLKKFRLGSIVSLVVFLTFNRTLLAWSSSGLETAMMDFFLILWVYVVLCNTAPSLRAFLGSLTSTFLALTRPDGLLFCVTSIIIVFLLVSAEVSKGRRRRVLLCGILPFSIVLMHQAWRLSFYGEWLPNTYYVKVSGSWPESGLPYLLSFILEYSLWFAIATICWALSKVVLERIRQLSEHPMTGRRFLIRSSVERSARVPLVVVGTLILHIGYYTYVVGGDHFEYRVYAHLLPLVFVALVWSLNRLRMYPFPAISVVLAFILFSMPVQWTHWALTKDLNNRQQTEIMRVPIAPSWPWMVRWYAHAFDEMQSWLIYHQVCMRHQEHKIFWQMQVSNHMSREEGLQIPRENYPLAVAWAVGVPSWVLPHVYIIDGFGLNDYIIARTPMSNGKGRMMSHSHRPPPGYIESFRPNLEIREGRLIYKKRDPPITSEYIIANERYWRDALKTIEHSHPADAQETRR
jgi:arabinofuranosyltransferase